MEHGLSFPPEMPNGNGNHSNPAPQPTANRAGLVVNDGAIVRSLRPLLRRESLQRYHYLDLNDTGILFAHSAT
jgi:hypothetical protein